MGHDEGNTLKSQGHHEGLRALPRNPMECGFFDPRGGGVDLGAARGGNGSVPRVGARRGRPA
jgi:hypothetical protein